jgi:hypothetical protein
MHQVATTHATAYLAFSSVPARIGCPCLLALYLVRHDMTWIAGLYKL